MKYNRNQTTNHSFLNKNSNYSNVRKNITNNKNEYSFNQENISTIYCPNSFKYQSFIKGHK